MLKFLLNIAIVSGFACHQAVAAGSCKNANWWRSFDKTGWSKCPSTFPYINGLYRNRASRPSNDWIYLLEQAKCCKGSGNTKCQCVQANWVRSFDRNRNWNLCPTGYYLSGLYRSNQNYLHNIEHAWCCKPRGAPNSYKSCYNENVKSRFDWNRKAMVTCSRAGYYITGLYRSSCDRMYCIELFKCCKLEAAEVRATCSATGDPHYRTFDGRTYDFMGQCEYVLAKDTNNKFTVLAKNKPCGDLSRRPPMTCVATVTLKVKGLEVKILRGGLVQMSGRYVKLPYSNKGVKVVKHGGRNVIVTTDIGLTVQYDGVYNVFVSVLGRYKGKMRGLCGTFNGNTNDDFLKPNNKLTTNAQEFGISWKVDKYCLDAGPVINPCKSAGARVQEAKKKCGLLRGHPFSACHKRIKVDSGFIQNCEYDVCACKNQPLSCLCEEYDAYVTTCSLVGVNIKWKHLTQFRECQTACALAPCLNGGTCKNVGNTYKCTCPVGFKGSRCETEACKDPKALGMESGKIPDSRITASSAWNQNHRATNARLNFAKNSGSWSSRQNNVNQWLQVDFKYRATITDILTQGRGRYNQWVKTYTVSYSDDGVNFKPYRKSGVDKIFLSNSNQHSIVKNTLQPVIVARFIRILPKSWNKHISMRAEFIGCYEGQPCAKEPCLNEGKCDQIGDKFTCSCLAGYYGNTCEQKVCQQPLRLGMENGEILNSQISASSEWDPNHGAINSRLNFRAHGRRKGAWSAKYNNANQWLQVNFQLQATITEILTQGRSNHKQWVKSYTVSYSNDGVNFFEYRVKGVVKVFTGNRDRNTIVRQNVSPVIVAQYIRIHPASWHGHISMRVDFSGCLKEWPCEVKPCLNGGTCLDYRGGYLCACADGWGGKNCKQNIGNCVSKK